MADPTAYDLSQDALIAALQELVTTDYQPPSGPEYSFPAERMPISQTQFSLLSLPAGNGVLNRNDFPYQLVGLGTDAQTNAANQMVLKVGSVTGRAEAIVAGFFHVLTQDMTIDLPAVTATTTYYVCLTYDPRLLGDQGDEDADTNPNGPVSVQVYAGTPPTEQGRVHLVLHTITRSANQLLSAATIQRYRPSISPVVTVQSVAQLPAIDSVLYGTLGVIEAPDGSKDIQIAVPDEGEWQTLLTEKPGPWVASTSGTHIAQGTGLPPAYRIVGDKVEMRGRVKRGDGVATYSQFTDTNAYTVIPNAPAPLSGGVPILGGSTNANGLLRWTANTTTGAPGVGPLSGTATWMDLTGYSYYWK